MKNFFIAIIFFASTSAAFAQEPTHAFVKLKDTTLSVPIDDFRRLYFGTPEAEPEPEDFYNNDVYVIGCTDWDWYRGFLFKNDEYKTLGDICFDLDYIESIPYAICVSGKDVYIAGMKNNMIALGPEEGGGRQECAFLMKNNEMLMLREYGMSYGHSITVDGDDVYMAFTEANVSYVWHNGEIISLPTDKGIYINCMSIAAYNGDWYATGTSTYGNHSYLWKNGEVIYKDIPGVEYSFNGSGNGLHSLKATANGLYGIVLKYNSSDNYSISLWHDGEMQETGLCFSPYMLFGQDFGLMAINGEDIYIAGTKDNVPSVWKNGDVQPLTQEDNTYYPVGISVCGEDVYVAAYKYSTEPEDGTYTPNVIYKNGKVHKLPIPDFPSSYFYPIAIQAVPKAE